MSKPLSVSNAIKTRISTRAFLDKPVSADDVRAVLDVARWSPSGGNVQPWHVHVLIGDARQRMSDEVKAAIAANPFADESEIAIYPPKLGEPFRTRRYELGEAMYELLEIPREDKAARLQWLLNNYDFFGAPVGLFFSIGRQFDKGGWAHLGMFMQSIALAAEEKGFATCMQEAWAARARTVSRVLGLGEDEQLYCGMALGYADPDAPVNRLKAKRAEIDEITTFHTE